MPGSASSSTTSIAAPATRGGARPGPGRRLAAGPGEGAGVGGPPVDDKRLAGLVLGELGQHLLLGREDALGQARAIDALYRSAAQDGPVEL